MLELYLRSARGIARARASLVGLELRDIDWAAARVRVVGKGRREVRLPLPHVDSPDQLRVDALPEPARLARVSREEPGHSRIATVIRMFTLSILLSVLGPATAERGRRGAWPRKSAAVG